MTHIGLYALRGDLVGLLQLVESEGQLKYTLTGNFLIAEVESGVRGFQSGADIPNLGTASGGSSAACEEFLVCDSETPVNLRIVGRNSERACVDQLANSDSVTFKPGGIWSEQAIIGGRVATASDSPLSRSLMKRFHAAATQLFSKMGSYYVGAEALKLMDEGKRLTNDVQSPPEYDLVAISSAQSVRSEQTFRLSYEESYRLLQRLRYPSTPPVGTVPPLPNQRPQFDDEVSSGIHFFRTYMGEDDFESLTLPRMFFGRSEITSVSFKNADLHESTMCWNDFNSVDFTDADLSDCDLRASIFRENNFVRANLRNADLRRSSFKDCDFTDADMRGAKLTRNQGDRLRLSVQQRQVIDWQESDGDEPPGG